MIYILASIGFIVGLLVGYFVHNYLAEKQAESKESQAKKILSQAKVKGQEIFFKAREEALEIIEKAKKDEIIHRKELKSLEERLDRRQSIFEKKIFELEERQRKLAQEADKLAQAKEKIRELYKEADKKLEEISGLDKKEARQVLFETLEKEYKDDILARIKKLQDYGAEEISKRAKEMLTLAMERYASSQSSEMNTSSVHFSSDEMKGRIIGREGRNIRAVEQATGAEIIVDDTPNIIFVSAFNPIRRELAKRVLEKLIADGRIQPVRIEKTVEKVKEQLAQDIRETGEDAAYKAGIAGLPPKIVQLMGRLKYRSSYGQNVLQHSIEVAGLSAMLASELGANVSVAKKAGFLHDIGKSMDHEIKGTHPEIGKEIGEKYGLSKEVIIPIATHHDDHPPTLEAVIVKVADAISGARPGARRDTYEEYIKRLEDLEAIAKRFSGVEKSYAIQAGRELRVFVKPTDIDDLKAAKLARQIAEEIEGELKYPGEIKVTVIRENRIIEYAR